MFGAVKLALAGGLFAAAIPVLAVTGAPQDPLPAASAFHQETTWNLAVLQYTTIKGDTVEVPARLLTKVWLLKTPEGQLRMELLFENRDYSSVEVRNFSLIRSASGTTAVDVPFVRGSIEDMAFPSFK